MTQEINILLLTAASIGFLHTILGPDHYLPFIVMARSGKWSKIKTLWITALCGTGHVLGSVILGLAGIAFGFAVSQIEIIEGIRGDIAAWILIGFGFVYLIWGLKQIFKSKSHAHLHAHNDGTMHVHEHTHRQEHSHIHNKAGQKSMTAWVLFTIFVFGPCEPLIPLLMYPAAAQSYIGLILVASVFGLVTIGTMLGIVMVSVWGIGFLPSGKLERYSHALAGAAICLSGLAIVYLGL